MACVDCDTVCPECAADDSRPPRPFAAGDAVTVCDADDNPLCLRSVRSVFPTWVYVSDPNNPKSARPECWYTDGSRVEGETTNRIRHTLPTDAQAIEAARLARAKRAVLVGFAERCAREAIAAALAVANRSDADTTAALGQAQDRAIAAWMAIAYGVERMHEDRRAWPTALTVAADLDALLAGVV